MRLLLMKNSRPVPEGVFESLGEGDWVCELEREFVVVGVGVFELEIEFEGVLSGDLVPVLDGVEVWVFELVGVGEFDLLEVGVWVFVGEWVAELLVDIVFEGVIDGVGVVVFDLVVKKSKILWDGMSLCSAYNRTPGRPGLP